jgi:undecaprenyl-diphosphatase
VNPWEALVLGIIQGATEFLPVSSSGHLVMGQVLLGLDVPGVVFEVAVHVATLVSVIVVYRQRLARLIRGAFSGEAEAWQYLGLLVVATVPAAVVGVGFERQVDALFDNPAVVGYALLVTGVLLWSTRAALKRQPEGKPDLKSAILIGLAQSLALVPGISRSGATVVMALWLGIGSREAAAFSFLMAIPAIAGAAVLKTPDLLQGGAGIPGLSLAVATVAAGVTGVLAIRAFNVLLQRQSFYRFGVYCWAAGAAFLLYLSLS